MVNSKVFVVGWRQLLVIANVCFLSVSTAEVLSEDRLFRDVASARRCRGNPALVLSISEDGVILFSQGFGCTDLESCHNVTTDTRFGIGGLSNSFAATLLVKLLHKNGKSTSAKVTDIMGSDFQLGDDVSTREATVDDVLTHRMGVPSHNLLRFSGMNRTELTGQLRYLRPTEPLRTKFMANSLMYGLATRMAEVLGKERWEDLVRKELLEPLGMVSTTFMTEVEMKGRNIATPYASYHPDFLLVPNAFLKLWAELCGAGCVVSTAKDMAKWAHFHTSKGMNLLGKRVMDSNLFYQLEDPRMTLPDVFTTFSKPMMPHTLSFVSATLAWRLGFYKEYPIVGHSSATYGYYASLIMLPIKRMAVFVAFTGDDGNLDLLNSVLAHSLDLALGEKPWLDASTMCSYPAPWLDSYPYVPPRKFSRNTGRTLESYMGSYSHQAYGTLEISMEGPPNVTELMLILRYGVGEWRLSPLGKDKFFGTGVDVALVYDIPTLLFKDNDGDDVVDELDIPGLTSFHSTVSPVFAEVQAVINGTAPLAMGTFPGVLAGAFISHVIAFG